MTINKKEKRIDRYQLILKRKRIFRVIRQRGKNREGHTQIMSHVFSSEVRKLLPE
jgi:hypothetical protein